MTNEALKHEGGDACPTDREKPLDFARYVIRCHDGNAEAAIEAMQDEIEHLQRQLQLATTAMGRGFTRGWVPSEERP